MVVSVVSGLIPNGQSYNQLTTPTLWSDTRERISTTKDLGFHCPLIRSPLKKGKGDPTGHEIAFVEILQPKLVLWQAIARELGLVVTLLATKGGASLGAVANKPINF